MIHYENEKRLLLCSLLVAYFIINRSSGWFALAAIFGGTSCHSNSETIPMQRVHPSLSMEKLFLHALSKRNKEMSPKMATRPNDLLVQVSLGDTSKRKQ